MSHVPFWYRFAPFLGRPPELSQHQWKLLGLLSAVSFFEQYDMYLFSLNLTQIQAELLIAESDVGFLGAFVKAGSFLAVFLAIAADRYGRRSTVDSVDHCGWVHPIHRRDRLGTKRRNVCCFSDAREMLWDS